MTKDCQSIFSSIACVKLPVMLLLKVLAALAALTLTAASPLDIPHYVHEKRAGPPRGWTKRNALDRRAVLPMRIGLKQSNLEKTWEWLSDVSHPESENYGRHWSAKQVAEAFAPRYGKNSSALCAS